MVSRRDSLAKMDKALKDLAKKVPEGQELYDILFSLGEPDQNPDPPMDRTVAIIAASYVDHALQLAIITRLNVDPQAKGTKSLFNGEDSPLGTLNAKITMASALKIIDERTTENLHTIRIIRNNFAHSMIHLEFSNEAVSKLCATLFVPPGVGILGLGNLGDLLRNPKERFIHSVIRHFYELRRPKTRQRLLADAARPPPSPGKSK